MSYVHLVAGVGGVTATLTATGYAVLSGPLHGRSVRDWASYIGVALLVGAGAVGVLLCEAAVIGVRTGLATFFTVAAIVSGTGLAASRLPGWRGSASAAGRARPVTWLAAVAAALLVGMVALLLVDGLRSSPRLDDVWSNWVPKGISLQHGGLHHGGFTNEAIVPFDEPQYPLLWSALLAIDLTVVGGLDLRAVDLQLAVLTAAFFAAAVRLLWGIVRPSILFPALLLLSVSPELRRQIEGGGADIVLAIFLTLFAISLAGFAGGLGRTPALVLATIAAAAALQTKSEGWPQAVVALLAFTLAWRHSSPALLARMWVAGLVAFASFAPFLAWRLAHGLDDDITPTRLIDPVLLADRAERVGPAARGLAGDVFEPRRWLVVVTLVLVLSPVAAALHRRWLYLLPGLMIITGYGLWVLAFWSDPQELDYRLDTAGYRVVTPIAFAAGLALPLLLELVATRRQRAGPLASE